MIEIVTKRLLDNIYTLEKDIFQKEAYSYENFKQMFENDRYIFLVDKEITSYLILYDAIELYEVIKIGVLQNERGKGRAKALFQFYLDNFTQDLFLEVKETNHTAIGLYKKIGFKEISKRKNYYSNGETAVIMQLKNKTI